jgi:hypothetical protein
MLAPCTTGAMHFKSRSVKFRIQTKLAFLTTILAKLVYEVKGNSVVPVWHAEYGDYLLKYDAITGDTYREK